MSSCSPWNGGFDLPSPHLFSYRNLGRRHRVLLACLLTLYERGSDTNCHGLVGPSSICIHGALDVVGNVLLELHCQFPPQIQKHMRNWVHRDGGDDHGGVVGHREVDKSVVPQATVEESLRRHVGGVDLKVEDCGPL
ncbi:hypothetical protein FNV43_RR00036 [Rhamnella rubrinervis]|uniref:Uncharacterized protein n=1 Tax=Rhamnella rubrinervis TaxID=2594499 RepID=A0A8K0HMV2_9ROSA|nr:hypothetical protein FNV43_RR00036 [Rhamnella rubrinervis]